MLKGKQIVLGVTGGIAAYKAVEVVRLLVKEGADVHVIMTKHAKEFVTPLTFQALSNNPVHTELFDLYQEREIGHISLADRADLFLIAPATANIVGKIAHGIADDLLSTTLLATKAKILFAPAMNVNMWENPLYRENQIRLESLGYHFVEPDTGSLACGWEGKGKLPDPAVIVSSVCAMLVEQDMSNDTVLVTAGPTREQIDPVRYLSNHSSGKMGYAIARAARERGARVILVSGPTSINPPAGVEFESVCSAEEMHDAVHKWFPQSTIVIKAAAVADYRPDSVAESKIKKKNGSISAIRLVETPDILASLGARKKGQFLVGFAAETDGLIENAREKLTRKNLDMIVANDVTQDGAGFDVDTNVVRFIYPDGKVECSELLRKDVIAHHLFDRIMALKQD